MTTKELNALMNKIDKTKSRSCWFKGVKTYALDLLDTLYWDTDYDPITTWSELNKALLNGANSWLQYSEGGLSLIWDSEIAERLCTPSELKRTDYGLKNPNKSETWIQVQARALYQAARLIETLYNNMQEVK